MLFESTNPREVDSLVPLITYTCVYQRWGLSEPLAEIPSPETAIYGSFGYCSARWPARRVITLPMARICIGPTFVCVSAK
jgi:hypothetical protein